MKHNWKLLEDHISHPGKDKTSLRQCKVCHVMQYRNTDCDWGYWRHARGNCAGFSFQDGETEEMINHLLTTGTTLHMKATVLFYNTVFVLVKMPGESAGNGYLRSYQSSEVNRYVIDGLKFVSKVWDCSRSKDGSLTKGRIIELIVKEGRI